MFWLWVIALLLAIPTYGISVVVALVLTFINAKKQVEAQILASLLLNAAMASIIMDKHKEKLGIIVFLTILAIAILWI